uniref:Uncharacterized protein n=1 Tax=Rhizophora mucronata TaxID=61149 RepID=A0A2P2NHX3_RHIMU
MGPEEFSFCILLTSFVV